MPSKQETFDTVVAHLRKQGRAAVSAAGACRYRSDEGDKCAVGCLIPDERYRPLFEGKRVDPDDPSDHLTILLTELGHSLSLCQSLQHVHDRMNPSHWEKGFRIVARDHHLTYTPA